MFTIQFYSQFGTAQIANYVNNGSFEDTVNIQNFIIRPKYWGATDTTKYYGLLQRSPSQVPLNSFGYQWPRTGKNYFAFSPFCPTCGSNKRGYPRNRLKTTLQQGSLYCVSFYVNLSHQSTHGIDAISVYFGDNSLDTISQCNKPILYLIPQINNTVGNIIVDTLNWVAISGTFTSNGTEKYILIGNFKSDADTDTALVNSTNLPANVADYFIDDVSVIPVELPAFSGSDIAFILGDSLYLGRERDIGIDEACIWYKYPDMLNPIDTAAGIWVKPVATSTYIVRQQLWCSGVKWDTVVVYQDFVGIEKLKVLSTQIQIFPVPANEYIELKFSDATLFRDFKTIRIYNHLSQLVKEEELSFRNNLNTLFVSDLPNGIYSLHLVSGNSESLTKRFVIEK